MGIKERFKKFKLNRLFYVFCCIGLAFTATGCSANAKIVLTNATQDVRAVGDRNLAVIEKLETKGVISSYTATTYRTAIEAKKVELTELLNGDGATSLTSDQKTRLDTLKGALVGVIGLDEDENYYGVHVGDFCDIEGCPSGDQMYALDGFEDAEIEGGASGYTEYQNYMEKPHGDEASEQPITFLDEKNMKTLLDELNRNIWVLKPGSITNQEQMFDCLNCIQQVKTNTDNGTITEQQQIGMIGKYFQPVEGLTVYNLDATEGNENSILALSEDNSQFIGSVVSTTVNEINKDIVVSAPITFLKHSTDENGAHKTTKVTRDVGVYSFRVKEFKKDFMDTLDEEVFTTNQYIAVNPSPSAVQTNSVYTGIALLMEYPVMALSELSSTNANTGDWEFKCLDYESTGMRINIYTGEMLVKDENGKWVRANVPKNNTEPLYRVFPENLGFISSDKNKVSFMPSLDSVTLSSGEIISNGDAYDKVKLLKQKDDDERKNEVLEDFDLDLSSIFPEPYLYREHHYIRKLTNGNYEVSEVGANASSNLLELKATVYSHDNSLGRKMNVHSWDALWELYDELAEKVKEKAHKDFGSRENFILYKIYEQLNTENKMLGSGGLDDMFTQAFIYNAFMYHFTEDDTNYLLSSCGNEFDKYWDEHIQEDMSFSWVDPNEETATLQEYHYVIDLWQHGDTRSNVESALYSLGEGYGDICEEIANYRGFNAIGYMYKDTYDLYKFEQVTQSVLYDENCGKEIELTDSNRDNLKYDPAGRVWEFKYAGKNYIVTPMVVRGKVTSSTEITTIQFILMDYLELTYLPGVVEGEPFVATGRRIKFDKLKGSTDDVIGVYANKYGDPLLTGDGTPINVKVSDLIDYTSGSEGYYEGIAKCLAFNGLINEGRVTAEINSHSKEKMREVFEGEAGSNAEDTGLVQDTQLLPYNIYQANIKPVLQFTSEGDGDKPPLDAMDVGNSEVAPSLYYGICVNTNAYQTGLFTGWVDILDDGGENGSLNWWKSWLDSNGYQYGDKLNVDALKKAMSGLYAISLADVEGAIVFNTETLKVINKELNEEVEEETSSLLRTIQVIIGILFMVYGFFMMGAWLIDTNLVNGPGFLTIITFGRFVAIRDASEMPRMVDGKTYTDFKYLLVVTVLTTFLGILLVLFDIQDIWHVIDKLFSSAVDIFKGLLLNK